MTVLAQVIAISDNDPSDFITYVFKSLDDSYPDKYIMCTRFPNWEHRLITLNEIGYLNIEHRRAGIDQWYDGNSLRYYSYNYIQFMRFIPKPNEITNEYVL